MQINEVHCEETLIKVAPEDRIQLLLKCNPWSKIRFFLRSKPSGFVKVFDGVFIADATYKSIRVSYDTTAKDVIRILLRCYVDAEKLDHLCLLEASDCTARELEMDEKPLVISDSWTVDEEKKFFISRKLNNYQDEFVFPGFKSRLTYISVL